MYWELGTDLYELTMLAGYVHQGKQDQEAVFDLFFRKFPRNRDYVVAAGLAQAVEYLTGLRFHAEAIDFIVGLPQFQAYPDPAGLRAYLEAFRFTGTVRAIPEGTPVFPNEPLLEVVAPLGQAQVVETYLLSVVGHQSLVATKAARVTRAAGDKSVVDFGARRAHGREAAVFGARAAFIGGCVATSDVLAGKLFDIPCSGTQAHSWVQSYPTELAAFRAYAEIFREHTILLVDTYDTPTGVRRACQVAREMHERGVAIRGVRVDSGDLAEEVARVRRILDEEGCPELKIFVSSDLNEYKIRDLEDTTPSPDAYGVGTELQVSRDDPALSVVYKLVELAGRPRIKLSEAKVTYPGRKQVYRTETRDVIARAGETHEGMPLLTEVVRDGVLVAPLPTLREAQANCRRSLTSLVPHLPTFTVEPSAGLRQIVAELRAAHETRD